MAVASCYAVYIEIELQKYAPVLVYADEANRIIGQRNKIPVQMA